MGRLIGIDYGKKRTGVAASDTLQIIAGAVGTVATHELLSFLQSYAASEQIDKFVVGWPTQTNGRPSENQQRVRTFVGKLKKAFPGIPIELHDERFTSVMAHQAILESGIGKIKRRDKALVDEVSATIILQSYMETLRR